LTEHEITDRDLLWRVIEAAERFATESVIAAAEAGLDALRGVFVVVIDTSPFKLALTVDGIAIATKDADPALGHDVAELMSRGLTGLTPAGQQRAAALLENARAQIVALVPLGQDRASVHGVIVDRTDHTVQTELFVLTTEPKTEVVH
jgi:hypothetical protein